LFIIEDPFQENVYYDVNIAPLKNMYPISYISGTVKLWRDIMDVKSLEYIDLEDLVINEFDKYYFYNNNVLKKYTLGLFLI
jgi:hypothetical protein